MLPDFAGPSVHFSSEEAELFFLGRGIGDEQLIALREEAHDAQALLALQAGLVLRC